MDEIVKDQARDLYRTVHALKNRIAEKFQDSARSSTIGSGGDDLTFAQYNAIMTIKDHEELSLKDLADILRVSRPSASAMVDRLVELGVVEREQSQVDRREVRIRLSDSGLARFQDMEGQILECITELLVKLGPVYAAQWCNVYARIREIIQFDQDADAVQIQKDGVNE